MELRAGGGVTSSVATSKPVGNLSPLMLRRLRSIFDAISGSSDGRDRPLSISALEKTQRQTNVLGGGQTPDPHNITFDEFLHYVKSPSFSALGPPKSHDLSYPISNYFISSSHNTYLSGHQLYGQSSTDGYKSVLLRGCRCIEIDVWDGDSPDSECSKDNKDGMRKQGASDEPSSVPTPWRSPSQLSRGQPQVLHGYTLTKEVSFRDVCIAIRETAFITSDLPVIVSLEVHASLEQQEVMVEIMRDVWKNLLIDDTCEPDGQEKLPSPATLRRKILVKVKHAAPSGKGDGKIEATQSTKPKTPSSSSSSSSDTEIAKDDPQKEKKKKVKMLDALSGLGLYTRSYHFSSFDQPEATIPTHVFSLSEKALMGMQETHAPALFAHNRKYLMRAYPKGLRVSSSNLDPSVFWRRGVQMVALNWQKWDEGMMLNEGMFAGEGGWVLKPRGYRSGDEFAGKVGSSEGLVHGILDLTIQVFAGQSIPLPPGDDRPNSFHPYAKFELHSESAEEKAGRPTESKGRVKGGEHKARTHARKGTDPDFEGETLRFSAVAGVVEELSFLRLKIHDDEIGKDGMAAWSCIRLDRLQQGIRILSLMDTAGRESAGILLVRITKTLS